MKKKYASLPTWKKAIKLIGRADKSQKDQVTPPTERQTVTDRQKETASPKGRQNESNQNDYVKKKTKYFPQSILNEMS